MFVSFLELIHLLDLDKRRMNRTARRWFYESRRLVLGGVLGASPFIGYLYLDEDNEYSKAVSSIIAAKNKKSQYDSWARGDDRPKRVSGVVEGGLFAVN